jgi:hypothetical protein
MQHFLYFNPLPQGQGSLRPVFDSLFLKKSTWTGTSSDLSHPMNITPKTVGSSFLSLPDQQLQINAQKRFYGEIIY